MILADTPHAHISVTLSYWRESTIKRAQIRAIKFTPQPIQIRSSAIALTRLFLTTRPQLPHVYEIV